MTRSIGRALAALILCLPLTAFADANTALEKEIATLEQSFNAAYLANDVPKYFAYYADDLVALFPEGPTDLKAYRADWTQFIGKGNKIILNTLSDLLVRVSPAGDEATASYAVALDTRLADGKVTHEHFFETDIWLKRNGHWQVAHVHYSAAPAPKKP